MNQKCLSVNAAVAYSRQSAESMKANKTATMKCIICANVQLVAKQFTNVRNNMNFEISELNRLLTAVRQLLCGNPKYSFVKKSPTIGILQNDDGTFRTNGILWLHDDGFISLNEKSITYYSFGKKENVLYEFESWDSIIQYVEGGHCDSV